MLSARPIRAFLLGGRRVVACRVADVNPNSFLDKEFQFYRDGRPAGRIRIEGVSTAWNSEGNVFDFSYSGDEILADGLGDRSLITDGRYEEAMSELNVA